VTVRRLKSDLRDEHDAPRFPRRRVVMLEVEHPDSERAVHADLVAYSQARARRLRGEKASEYAGDFVATLLKKRLFSSPAAFARTLDVHRATLGRRRSVEVRPSSTVLQRLFEDAGNSLDEEGAEEGIGEAARDALEAAARAEASQPTAEEGALLERMGRWANQAAVREDARTARLLDWVESHVRAERGFSTERVIVFTEYRATQRYLQERLAARGVAGSRVELLDGTTTPEERERIKSQWQEPPADFPVRVLLATDAASEGISLQRHCHLLAHAEIPWNPNRLEQRNGRIDRHGQTGTEVLVHHCVSAGWETEGRGSIEGDLDFLARVVRKVEQIREDLGSAGPVIAAQVEEAMLGRRRTLDDTRLGKSGAARAVLREERRLRERLVALRDELHQSRETLQLTPAHVARVVHTALALARQPPLRPGAEAETWVVPALTGSWARGTIGLEHPARAAERRPVTFDHDVARGRTDVVLAHLGHPLVRMSLGLLRAEVWGTGSHLHRVALRYAEPALGAPVAVAHGRLVITGATGHRLHEEVIAAGIRLGCGNPERLGVDETAIALARQRDGALPISLRDRLIAPLQAAAESLRAALQARAADRARALRTTLANRAGEEQAHIAATLGELEATIRREAFGDGGDQLVLITGLELDAADRQQVQRDLASLRERLDRIPADVESEQGAIAERYGNPSPRLFPAAVTLLVSEGGRL